MSVQINHKNINFVEANNKRNIPAKFMIQWFYTMSFKNIFLIWSNVKLFLLMAAILDFWSVDQNAKFVMNLSIHYLQLEPNQVYYRRIINLAGMFLLLLASTKFMFYVAQKFKQHFKRPNEIFTKYM
jgi:hypothetical protein